MEQKINHIEFIQLLASRLEVSKADADAFAKIFFDTIEEYMLKDKLVKIKGLGTFKLVGVSDRESVDVNTGERIRIAGHDKVSFTPDPSLRDIVNRPFAEFQTIILNEDTDQAQMESLEPISKIDDLQVTATEVNEPEGNNVPQETESSVVEPSEESVAETAEAPVAEVSEESVVESGEETVPEPASVHVATENVAPTPVESFSISTDSDDVKSHKSLYGIVAVLVVVVCIGATAYFSGFLNNLIGGSQVQDKVAEAPAPATSEEVEKPQPVVKAEPTPEELAKNYPQVENGEYWIVGEIGTDTMKVGTNLYRISQKQLGDKKLMQYIVVFNDIKNPDVIPPGYVFHIPRMVKKTEK